MIGLEAMLRLFTEQEANEQAFTALTRFLDALDAAPPRAGSRAALDPLVLSFQLKLLWVPATRRISKRASSAAPTTRSRFVASAGGAAWRAATPAGSRSRLEGIVRDARCSPHRRSRTGGQGAQRRAAGCARRGHRLVRAPRRFPPQDRSALTSLTTPRRP